MAEEPTILTELKDRGLAVAGVNQLVLLDDDAEGIRWAVGVTDEHGLQTEKLDTRAEASTVLMAQGERYVKDVRSFLAEIKRRGLSSQDSATFWGDMDHGRITLIYDDHSQTEAGWRLDRLTLQLRNDEDWAAWHRLSGKYVDQEQLAEQLEELGHTIAEPRGADMLEIVRTLRATARGEFESRIEPTNGSYKVGFSQDVNTKAGKKGELEVPQELMLKLTPWDGHDVFYDVPAWFRLRVRDGELSVAVKLKPTRQLLRIAWDELCDGITEATGEPVLQTHTII